MTFVWSVTGNKYVETYFRLIMYTLVIFLYLSLYTNENILHPTDRVYYDIPI